MRAKIEVAFASEDVEHSAAAGLATLLTLDSGGAVFVKGQRARATPAADTVDCEGEDWWGPDWSPVNELDLEQAVNPHLPRSAPRVLWRVDVAGWSLLAFQGLPGRNADYTPGSPDLAPVADALAELGKLSAPGGVRLPTAWDRWGYYCDDTDQELLTGARLLHTDPASTNVLVDAERACLIDWSWAASGPTWIDATLWGMRLISTGGHSAEEAGTWASRIPGWSTADPRAVAVFARAEARRWRDLAAERVETADSIARCATAWADFLAARSPGG
ncbi:aminoglycoside phosphotransferase [Streptomyces sp. NPDC001941]|uniref:aminoglycoside phosphotransferase n=1 Tax=Streptomyces sp. NPDC001941 TaxID=3154659 RepID=UPI00332F43FF